MIRLIAAIDSCRGLATDRGIPWRLPGDSVYFREKTGKGVIVMGRTTYLEFAAPLGDRENYVLTHATNALRSGFVTVPRLDDVLERFPDEDVWVIGGATVYALAIDLADELLLTQVHGDFGCTKFFPPYDDFALVEFSAEHSEIDVSYRFERWTRRTTAMPNPGEAGVAKTTQSASGTTAPT
ncbi:MAG TPA: dihydrofolate reductase [Candidatus Dormibacteraeota bacterium]